MKRNRIGMLGIFLAVMLGFTFLSRAADSLSIARVTTTKAERGKITHTVRGSGKVEQNREQAVSTLPGQVVKAIYVEEGQLVQAGELLFEVDLESLQEQILEQKQEMEKEELLSGDKASSREAQALRDAISRSRAQEDYAVASGKGNTAVSRAAQELNEAQAQLDALEEFEFTSGESGTDAVEEMLQQTCEQKKKEYDLAVKYKEDLEAAIEEAVQQALAENSALETASAQVQAGELFTSGPVPEDSAESAEENMEFSAETLAEPLTDWSDGWSDGMEIQEGSPVETQGENVQAGETQAGAAESFPSQAEDPWLLEQRIRQQYQGLLDEAQLEIEKKEQEAAQAEDALVQYQQEKAANSQQSLEETRQQLLEEIKAKRQAYEDAVTAANDSLRSAGRSIEDASAPQGTDSTGKIDAITKEQAQLKLNKLERLMEAGGKVTAPVDGVVLGIHLTTGEKTPDGTAVLLSDLASGNRLVVQVPAEQDKHIARNDTVSVKADGKKKEWKDLTVDTVRVNEEDKNLLDVTVQLPQDSLEAGEAATMTATRTSESYECCVPVQALHAESGKYYVLVVTESESILGKEQTLQRIDVTVLDKNETDAALQDGSLGSQQQIVLTSDKEISAGSRVRVE